LITVNTIKVPEGVDWAALVKNAMDKFNLEIAGGLGPTMGKVWRVSGWPEAICFLKVHALA
jgi:alanine-glyoxylate transaminase/serine-glyoxylate transaminase/serine-pyruvate transaminase